MSISSLGLAEALTMDGKRKPLILASTDGVVNSALFSGEHDGTGDLFFYSASSFRSHI